MSGARCNRAEFIGLSPGKKEAAITLITEELSDLCQEVLEEVLLSLMHKGRNWAGAHVEVVVDLESEP